MNIRELVLSMLKEIYAGNEFSHILLRQVLEKYDYLEGNEKAFLKRLTEGTLETGGRCQPAPSRCRLLPRVHGRYRPGAFHCHADQGI